jgi:hypothetical protein
MWNHLVAVETAVMKENRFTGKWAPNGKHWQVLCPLCDTWMWNKNDKPEELARAHSSVCPLFQREYNNMLYRMRHLCASALDAVVRSP